MTNPKATALIQNYSDEALWNFINDRNHNLTRAFEPLVELQDENHPKVNKLGEITFSVSERLLVCSIAVAHSLNERSGKKEAQPGRLWRRPRPSAATAKEKYGREGHMKKYVCDICGYVYDPAVGDEEGGIAPGTAFEDLPEDWVCPLCQEGKEVFEIA